MATNFTHPNQLLDYVGKELGTSDWVLVDQQRINGFADVTEDHQWIHTDAERAKTGPFGTTIAHGYLTLSLAPVFLAQAVVVDNVTAAVNYGLNKVRFPSPVPVDSKVRGTLTLANATERGTAIEATFALVVEIDGATRPACVAEIVVLYSYA